MRQTDNMFLLIIIIVLIVSFYFYNIRTFDYWKKRGVKYEEPVLLFGTHKKKYLAKQSMSQLVEEMYWKFPNEKVVGGFKSTTPHLVIRDPELIKHVFTNDFTSFYRRGVNVHKKVVEPLKRHLFAIDGDLWRVVRQRLTPAFTSGKLKAMFPLIIDRVENLQARARAAARQNKTVNARDLMACFTTDFIGAVGFGIDSDSLNDDNSEFRKLGRKFFNMSYRDVIVLLLKDVFPELCKNLKDLVRIEKEMFALVNQIRKARNNTPSGRNDFIDLLLEYQQQGPMEAESIEMVNADGTPVRVSYEFDDDLLAAQVLVFYAAGFETSSSSTSFTLHQLAFNPEVQKKVQENIDSVLAKHNNKLSYEAVKEMTYLEWTFKEGMRMFPSLGHLMRMSTKKYTFKDINLSIDEDILISIPVQAIQNDPKYWDKPEEFRPERFHPDNFTEVQKSVYFPFGEGPRMCIGKNLLLLFAYLSLVSQVGDNTNLINR